MSAARQGLDALARERMEALARELAAHPGMKKALQDLRGAWVPVSPASVIGAVLADAVNTVDLEECLTPRSQGAKEIRNR